MTIVSVPHIQQRPREAKTGHNRPAEKVRREDAGAIAAIFREVAVEMKFAETLIRAAERMRNLDGGRAGSMDVGTLETSEVLVLLEKEHGGHVVLEAIESGVIIDVVDWKHALCGERDGAWDRENRPKELVS